MTIDPELRQMLRDAAKSRAHRSRIVRAWHAAAERIDIVSAAFRHRERQPRGSWMLFDDLRHATRRLRLKPGTAAACAAMLALAIGVTSAMFTVADHMLLRPAPFKDVERLKQVFLGREIKDSRVYLPVDVARSLRQSPGFAAVSYFVPDQTFVATADGLVNPGSYRVSPGAFEMLGVSPLLGRAFVAGDGREGDATIVISERLWRSGFSADPDIVGRTILANGAPLVVIGVMPDALRFPSAGAKAWRPLDVDAPPAQFAKASAMVFARLTNGVSVADAARLATDVSRPLSATPTKHGVVLRAVGDGYLDTYSKTAIRVLLAGVGLVFLVLCANVTNLVLARTTARRQEFGVCSALGASRMRLVRQVALENAVIGVAALALGLAASWGLVTLARSFLPETFLISTLNPLSLDARAFGMAAALAVVATIAAGLPPAWIGTRLNAADSIRLESRGSSESRVSRVWNRALLIGEVALASTLLIGAGVLLTSFVKLTKLDSGLDVRGVTTVYVTLPEFAFKDRPARAAFAEQLQSQVRSLPGVTAVALSFGLPPNGGAFSWGHLIADGVPRITDHEQEIYWSNVTADFFGVYGIRLTEGRTFAPDDADTDVIVSEGLAAMLWPGQSPLGHTFQFEGGRDAMTVIGVSREVRSPLGDPRDDLPEFYRRLKAPGSSQVMLGLRCAGVCPGETAIRERMRLVSAQAVLHEVKTLESAYLSQFAKPRAAAGLALAFAAVSVLAAAGGLFSILTYAVSRRRREFGVRSALGASPQQLRILILKDGLTIAATGLALGGALTLALNQTLKALAFGVTAAHPAVWLSVAFVVGAVTMGAAWRPAANAMRSDPISLLHEN